MQTQLSSILKAELQPNVTLFLKNEDEIKIDKPDGENVFLTTTFFYSNSNFLFEGS